MANGNVHKKLETPLLTAGIPFFDDTDFVSGNYRLKPSLEISFHIEFARFSSDTFTIIQIAFDRQYSDIPPNMKTRMIEKMLSE
jgi:hypothetical protein